MRKNKKKKEEGGGIKVENELQTLRKVVTFDLKKESLLLIRLCRHTTAHFVLTCPCMYDLNINDVILHSFIINNYTVMR